MQYQKLRYSRWKKDHRLIHIVRLLSVNIIIASTLLTKTLIILCCLTHFIRDLST